jgi:hypothetical protein
MIKHSLTDELIHISIDNVDFSYRIPVKKIGNTISWNIGEKGKEGILMKNVSTWTLRLFTKQITEDKYIQQFKSIVQEYAPNNSINWEETLLAVNIQNEYNLLITANITSKEKKTAEEILSIVEAKYKLD